MEWRVVSPELRQRTAVPIGSDLLVRALPQSPNGAGAKEEKPQPLLVRDMDARHQEALDGQQMTAQCAFCPWTFTGPAGEARAAGKQHRETEHPDAGTRKAARDSRPFERKPPTAEQAAGAEARRAIHERAEQRRALERMDEGEPQAPEELGAAEGAADPSAGELRGRSGGDRAGPLPDEAQTGHGPKGAERVGRPEQHRAPANRKWTRASGIEAIQEFALEHGRPPTTRDMNALASLCSQRDDLGSWADLVEAAGFPRPARGGHRFDTETAAEAARKALAARGVDAYQPDEIIDAIRRWASAHDGVPPVYADWKTKSAGYPASMSAARVFGSWAAAIEAAGFPRPTRAEGINRKASAEAGQVRQQPPSRIRVPGTGLSYRTSDEAYVAADEIEFDGERVAENARRSGDEARADQAIDRARVLAEKIRAAARVAAGQPDPMVEPEEQSQTLIPGLPPPVRVALADLSQAIADWLRGAD